MNHCKTLHALALAGTVCAVQAHETHEADEHRRHDAHQHGVAQFNVALEGRTLEIELTSPAMNIVGFEHLPSTESQQQTVAEAARVLKESDRVFTLPGAADCSPSMAEVTSELLEGQEHEEEHDHQEGEMHSEFKVSYRFDCNAPGELEGLEVRLFELFPSLNEIQAQVIGPGGQTARTLTGADPRLAFPE